MNKLVLGVAMVCGLAAASAPPTTDVSKPDIRALSFQACPWGFSFHKSASESGSLTGHFISLAKDINLALSIGDKPAALEVYRRGNVYFIDWWWSKPDPYALDAMTAMAVARRRIHFVLHYHANPGASETDPTADGMILDDYSFTEDGAC